jgi:hypothetical protein
LLDVGLHSLGVGVHVCRIKYCPKELTRHVLDAREVRSPGRVEIILKGNLFGLRAPEGTRALVVEVKNSAPDRHGDWFDAEPGEVPDRHEMLSLRLFH